MTETAAAATVARADTHAGTVGSEGTGGIAPCWPSAGTRRVAAPYVDHVARPDEVVHEVEEVLVAVAAVETLHVHRVRRHRRVGVAPEVGEILGEGRDEFADVHSTSASWSRPRGAGTGAEGTGWTDASRGRHRAIAYQWTWRRCGSGEAIDGPAMARIRAKVGTELGR